MKKHNLEKDLTRLDHILDACVRAEKVLEEDECTATEIALERLIEIVGEATKNLSETVKKQYPNVPWEKIAGMRNVLVHEYHHVISTTVWNVASKELPKIKKQVQKIIKQLEGK